MNSTFSALKPSCAIRWRVRGAREDHPLFSSQFFQRGQISRNGCGSSTFDVVERHQDVFTARRPRSPALSRLCLRRIRTSVSIITLPTKWIFLGRSLTPQVVSASGEA